MMKPRSCAFIALFVLTACGSSPDSRFYTLSASSGEAAEPAPGAERFTLADVIIPGVLDKPQMIMKSGANEIQVLEYDRWAEPLDGMITRILADDLVARGAVSVPADAHKRGHRIEVTIDELDGDSSSGQVLLKARWTVMATGDHPHAASHSFEKREAADTDSINAVVAAESHLLGDLAGTILGSSGNGRADNPL